MHLAGLFIYPVKSLRGTAVAGAAVDALGLVGDRRYMVVDANGRFLTQRVLPRMALIEPELTSDTLRLTGGGAGGVTIGRNYPSEGGRPLAIRKVTVWQAEGLAAEDCGDDAAAWLGGFLGVDCRLVRIGPEFSRAIPAHKVPATMGLASGGPGGLAPPLVSFADGYPFLAVGEASLENLNDLLAKRGEEAVPMNRFRPNLVISGSPAFAEDTWKRVRIGSVIFHAAGHSARCVITCIEQSTAQRSLEPLRTLADYRRDPVKPANVNFGENLINETKSGILRVGDPVEILP